MDDRSLARRRRFLAPEVVQTSPVDCGPAALACLLRGYGIAATYENLRDACETDVDGTSIDAIEAYARERSLDARQLHVPRELLASGADDLLPALVVTRLPDGANHFVVCWRRMGGRLQVMDPATGRRWPLAEKFLEEVHEHTLVVPAAQWRAWAGSPGYVVPLRRRLVQLGRSVEHAERLVRAALSDPGWEAIAALDAATRLAESVLSRGGLRRGDEALRAVSAFAERARAGARSENPSIPCATWPARPAGRADGVELLEVRGAVLLSVAGRRRASGVTDIALPGERGERGERGQRFEREPRPSAQGERAPLGELWRLLRADGRAAPAALVVALFGAAFAVLVQALLLRGLIDVGQRLPLPGERLAAIGALVLFALAAATLDVANASNVLRFGRRLELRLRLAFQEKIPRLADRFFHSRPGSDMAERGHGIVLARGLPGIAAQFLRSAFELCLTAAGIVWLDPEVAPIALAAVILSIALPLLGGQRFLVERDLRVRTHGGALARFHLDALQGCVPIRTHGAARAVRREHEGLLVEWRAASVRLAGAAVSQEVLLALLGYGFAAWIVAAHLAHAGDAGGALLLVYWTLGLPVLGERLAALAQQYPGQRNAARRLLEPLGAAEEADVHGSPSVEPSDAGRATEPGDEPRFHALREHRSRLRAAGSAGAGSLAARRTILAPEPRAHEELHRAGAAISLCDVSVEAGGRALLVDLDLELEPGSHTAIVGASGAGKSTLLGLLLGFHAPSRGALVVDGGALDVARLRELRRSTAWVDPAVQLWNRSLLENLLYGASPGTRASIAEVLRDARLLDVVGTLERGLATPLGEGGALVSGGEGQRVRLARAMFRRDARLALLDEPFRGLDPSVRRELLVRARELWSAATLLCVTHDVEETLGFARVLVVDHGRIVEDGAPAELARRTDSRYRRMLDEERGLSAELASSGRWRRLWIEDGRLCERGQGGGA